ncbi:YgcG family protein [Chitinophaga sp. S165]|uniref:TPM domain-containing protein n=1 Tax=Chitinophaga sp. S165 TaxID=2135462 RepID=UPI000D71A96E|nr:TPM domain-containing protein [Chitinophaga sp. S165]PWV46944.1 uncharacterized protein C7475_10931 [Chitinophaga sp. S165]
MAHTKRWYLYLLSLLFALACGETKKETGFSIEKIPDPMVHGGYVSNPDNIISQETAAMLNSQMQQLDQSGRAQVAIVLLETIGDKVPKDVAHDLFRLWKPGQQGKDNGLVVLLVNDQHRIEFETGYGLEGDLPDVICFRIQQSEMLPSFREKNIDEGMLKGMNALVNVLQPPADTAMVAQADGTTVTDTSAAAVMPLVNIDDNIDQQTETINYEPEPVYNGPGVGTLVLYLIYAIFCTIFVVRPGVAKKHVDTPSLFKARIWHKLWLYLSPFVFLLILVNIPGTDYNWWLMAFLLYINLVVYLTYRAILINRRSVTLLKDADRHRQFETLNMSHVNHWFSAVFFPIPMLAYSRWHTMRMNKLRFDPYDCEACHQPMTLLKRGKKKALLDPVQTAEDKVGSVIYDAWLCKNCDDKKIIGYRNLCTDAEKCPTCSAVTLVKGKSRVVRAATTSREGEGIQHYICKHCQYTYQETYVIAKLSSSSSGGSSSGSSGSSSSSGSWGGGSSGGGGAGSSW